MSKYLTKKDKKSLEQIAEPGWKEIGRLAMKGAVIGAIAGALGGPFVGVTIPVGAAGGATAGLAWGTIAGMWKDLVFERPKRAISEMEKEMKTAFKEGKAGKR